jgi:hypothetical protein
VTFVPIGETRRRLPQAGRIRLGAKDARAHGGRRAINIFRFTSGDAALLAPVADKYGGIVVPWNEPKSGDRFELVTETNKLDVILPPNALTERYEKRAKDGALVSWCDDSGRWLATSGPEGPEISNTECLCRAQGVLESRCIYKLRLSVMLPDVDSIGLWRLDTSSMYAREEIPGVVQVIEQIDQGRGLFRAILRLEQRTSPGRRFNVPVLDTGVGVEALLAGETRLNTLPATATPRAELGAGDAAEGQPLMPPAASPSTDDEVIDAVVFDEATGVQEVDPALGRAYLDTLTKHGQNKALLRSRELALELGEPIPKTFAEISPLIADRLAAEQQGAT